MVNCDLHGHLVPINGPLVKKPWCRGIQLSPRNCFNMFESKLMFQNFLYLNCLYLSVLQQSKRTFENYYHQFVFNMFLSSRRSYFHFIMLRCIQNNNKIIFIYLTKLHFYFASQNKLWHLLSLWENVLILYKYLFYKNSLI